MPNVRVRLPLTHYQMLNHILSVTWERNGFEHGDQAIAQYLTTHPVTVTLGLPVTIYRGLDTLLVEIARDARTPPEIQKMAEGVLQELRR